VHLVERFGMIEWCDFALQVLDLVRSCSFDDSRSFVIVCDFTTLGDSLIERAMLRW